MTDVKLLVSLIVTGRFRSDKAVLYLNNIFSDIRETAVGCYARFCELLTYEGKTLSEHLFLLAADMPYGEHGDNETFSLNINNDIAILSELAHISSEQLIGYIKERFSIPEGTVFPKYECGDTEISFAAVTEYRRTFGSPLFADNKAFVYKNGELVPVKYFDNIRLSELKNYSTQRQALIDNTLCFIKGLKYSSALLYGDRGTGKSSTVKAIVNEYPELRIVFIEKHDIMRLYSIYDMLRGCPMKFVLFLDDIRFSDAEPEYVMLKQSLEGSVNVIPENCVIYATTNRRHIIKETASGRSDDCFTADEREEKMSLTDRFGLYITFMSPDKKDYLSIAKQIAEDRGIDMPEEQFCVLAERFAVRKGGRSPRTARQFVDMLGSRLDLGLSV